MHITPINNLTFSSTTQSSAAKKNDLLALFHEKTKNSADMTDTVVVPRTIFKGYLAFMAGTTLTSLGAILKEHKNIAKTFNIAGLLTCLYGTYAFVRPFVIKDAKGVEKTK